MERLTQTEINEYGHMVSICKAPDGFICGESCSKYCPHVSSMIEKLAAYENAEEQGRLIELPCKVGNKFYWLKGHIIKEHTISKGGDGDG